MIEKDWGNFGVWADIFKGRGPSLESPFVDEPITNDSMFLWVEVGAPKHHDTVNGMWNCMPCPGALAGFLRYVVFPLFFEFSLMRPQWDANPDRYVRAEELFGNAEFSAQCHFKDDIPAMREIILQIDPLFDMDNDQIRIQLHAVAGAFNQRWANSSRWHFAVQVYDSPEAVGREILNRLVSGETPLGMSDDAWLKICASTVKNLKAQQNFKAVLKQQAWF